MNIVCGVEYDGTDYHGFQRQREEHGPTVQGELEAAIERISGAFAVVHGAGRTDAGVHASGQVIHFHSSFHLTPLTWQRALNAQLPKTIAVRWAREVAEDFHARFSACSRSYRYSIWNAAAPSPLHARYSYHRSQALNVALMHAAAQMLVGRKDFGAFGHSPDEKNPSKPGPHTSAPHPDRVAVDARASLGAASGASCVRTMLEARCVRQEGWQGGQGSIYCDFTADAFLTGMVRRMVGTLLLVGQHRLSLDEFATIVQRAEKTHPGSAAPPHGLCLVRVDYPEQFGVMNNDEDI